MLSKRVTKSDLLLKIHDEEIFKKYFGDFSIDKSYNSVFRQDRNPSTGFYINRNNKLIYNDFVTGEKLDCVDFVAKSFNISIDKAIKKILNDFNIEDYDHLNSIESKVVKHTEKKKKEYSVGYIDWDEKHLEYWKQYYITQKELEDNYVYTVNSVYVNGYCVANGDQLRFCYLINTPKDTYIKVYSPHDTEYKWIGNVPITVPFGFFELPYKSDTLFIQKSNKDRIIFKKYFTDVIALQNESKNSLTKEMIEYLKSKYKRIIICFDTDKAGIEAAYYYNKTYDWEHLKVPTFYYTDYGIKDFADLVKERGIKVFENYLKHKELI